MIRVGKPWIFVCFAITGTAMAQGPSWDSGGNSQLNGSYYFRQVVYNGGGTPSLSSAASYYGGISFDGNGHWTISGGQQYSSNNQAVQAFNASGTYTISQSGFGFLTSPADSSQRVYVMVVNGVAIGSTTENPNGYNDLFIAAQIGSPQPGLSSLSGSYQLAYYATAGDGADDVDALIQMNANGAGQVSFNMSGYSGAGGTATQTNSNLKYTYSNGAAVITFPNNANAPFIPGGSYGNEYLYMSPDGNFVFGGATNDFDIFVGVKTNGQNPSNFSGLYYQAGLDEDDSNIANNQATLNTWYGSLNVLGGNLAGNIISHQRVGYGATGYGYTFPDTYGAFQNGAYTNTNTDLEYVFSQNGAIRIGLGQGPYLGINVAIQAPTLNGNGVYLNPQGIQNSASFAPFTAGISNGELISLFGANLAQRTTTATSLPFPTNLGGVQVMINGLNAPLYYVSPTQISCIVPFENTFSIAQIQVNNGGTLSNVITTPVYQTTPGVYTISSQFGGVGPYGIGVAAAEHADYSVVSNSHPAQPGETIQLYLTGLGNVYPPNPDGAAGPANPLSLTSSTITMDIGGTDVATPLPFSGLAPALAGLYQINFQVPTSLSAGTYLVGVTGPDSYSDEAVLQVGSASTSTSDCARPAWKRPAGRGPRRAAPRIAPRAGTLRRSPPAFQPAK